MPVLIRQPMVHQHYIDATRHGLTGHHKGIDGDRTPGPFAALAD
jgi:hypothetical protein